MAKLDILALGVGLLAIGTAPVAMAQANNPLAAVQQCRDIAENAARLACFDKAVDRLTLATASGEAVVVDREQVRKARKGLFGFSMPSIAFLTGRPGNAEDAEDELRQETTVVSARSIGHGKWRFAVEGGGLWETTEASIGFEDPRPGTNVLLQRGALGSYYAKVGKGRRVRAKRVG